MTALTMNVDELTSKDSTIQFSKEDLQALLSCVEIAEGSSSHRLSTSSDLPLGLRESSEKENSNNRLGFLVGM